MVSEPSQFERMLLRRAVRQQCSRRASPGQLGARCLLQLVPGRCRAMPQLLKTKEEALQACAEQHREFAGRAALLWDALMRMIRQRSRLGLLAATCPAAAAAACRRPPPPAAASPHGCCPARPGPPSCRRACDVLQDL